MPQAEDVDVHQAAGNAVEPWRQAAKHFVRQARAEQNFAHPDEQRQRRQRPRIAVAPDRGGEHRAEGNAAADELHADIAGRHQGQRDPYAAGEQDAEEDQQQRGNADQFSHGQTPL